MQRPDHDLEMTTGRPVVQLLARVLGHLTIVLASILAILFLIDQAKRGEMSFLVNQATKWMLLALCVMAIAGALLHLSSLARLRSIRKYLALSNQKKNREQ